MIAPDPLSIVEVTDETGKIVRSAGCARAAARASPGMYQLRHVGPERTSGKRPTIALAAGEQKRAAGLAGRRAVGRNAGAARGARRDAETGDTLALTGREPMAWAQTSTLVALALGKALDRERGKAPLGLRPRRRRTEPRSGSGIVVCVVSEAGALHSGRGRASGLGGRRHHARGPSTAEGQGEARRGRRSTGSRPLLGLDPRGPAKGRRSCSP